MPRLRFQYEVHKSGPNAGAFVTTCLDTARKEYAVATLFHQRLELIEDIDGERKVIARHVAGDQMVRA